MKYCSIVIVIFRLCMTPLLILGTNQVGVEARSHGAAGCIGGQSAALAHPPPKGILSDGGYLLRVSHVHDNNTFTITLSTANNKDTFFRGFLLRMEDATQAQAIDSYGKIAQGCLATSGAVGVTHASSTNKTSVSASFTTKQGGLHTIDVTVVRVYAQVFYEAVTFMVPSERKPVLPCSNTSIASTRHLVPSSSALTADVAQANHAL